MSNLVYWFIAIGAYTVYFVIKSLKSNHSDVKGTPLGGEVFPEVPMYNSSKTKTYEEFIEIPKAKTKPKTEVKKRIATESDKTNAETAFGDKGKGNTTKISLKNRSEAKRAFIHAEILNKKYS